MTGIINGLISAIGSLAAGLLALLPASPFNWDLGQLGPYVGMINYFVPFQAIAGVMATYVTAVALWYVVRWALRFVRYIG